MNRWLVAGATLATALYAARRYYRNWGTTKFEYGMSLPGDEVIRRPAVQMTDAITVEARAADVWPWLIQLGYRRAGLYTGGATADLLGYHGADQQIRSEWQNLSVGDSVSVTPPERFRQPDGITLCVTDIEPERTIVLHGRPPATPWETVLSLHLEPRGEDRCRLVIRTRTAIRRPGQILLAEAAGPLMALAVRGALRGVKERAERAQSIAAAHNTTA